MKKRRITAALLAAVMALSTLPSVRAAGSGSAAGELQATVRLDYNQELFELRERGVQAELFQGRTSLGRIGLTQRTGALLGGYPAQVTLRDRLGGELNGSALPGALDLAVSGLPQGSYTLRFTGEGYTPCDVPFTISSWNQYVEVGTGDGTFALGDVDGSGRVDARDRAALSDALGSTSRADLARYDLNGDGQIDIVDLAYVNHNANTAAGGPVVLDTACIGVRLDAVRAAAELSNMGTIVSGSLDSLLQEGGYASFQNASGQGDIRIPIPLEEMVTAENLQIVTPDTAAGAVLAGTVEVEHTGGTISRAFTSDVNIYPQVHAITRTPGTNVITIPLGQRVAVKKVTITVTRTAGDQYAVVETVRFLRDIAPEGLTDPNSLVKNLSAVPGDGQVSLTWDRLNNVSGYRVEYWQEGRESARRQLTADVPRAQVTGLDNLKTYLFAVTPVDGSWQGERCTPVAAVPQPARAPSAPEMVNITALDSQLEVSWKNVENATYYEVYYTGRANAAASDYQRVGGQITGTKLTISGLTNGASYQIYIVAGNRIGRSGPSRIYTGVPVAANYSRPEGIPTQGLLDRSKIAGIALADPSNYDASQYPGGSFSVQNVIDDNFRTHWTVRDWSHNEHVVVTFTQPVDLSAAIWVPRLDGAYRNNLRAYSVQVWYQGENLSGPGHLLTDGVDNGGVGNSSDVLTWPNIPNLASVPTSKFAVLPFGPAEKVVKISVAVEQRDYTAVSLSELMFLEYDPARCLPDNIAALFADELRTCLADGVTQARIDELRARLNSDERYYYLNLDVLEDELALAQELLTQKSSSGVVIRGIQSRSSAADSAKYQQGGSDLQPLGAAALAGQDIVVYATGIPDGETVNLYATQFNTEVSSWQSLIGPLSNGRNILTVPKIGSQDTPRGGSLYITYSGSQPRNIQLHVRRAVDIPLLELSDWYSLDDSARRTRIGAYVDELTAYVSARGFVSDAQTNCLNVTELSMPAVLLSLPAAAVLNANGQTREGKIENLYQNVLAWEDLMHICKTTQGIDNTYDGNDMTSRQNIRCMQMFSGAFMYAAGSHVGIGYGSCAGVVSGRPIAKLEAGATANSLFGWGIAHEIGHNMDKLGRAEITNNIYSLMVQTCDGRQNTLPSRLELGGKYPAIFTKTAQGMPGESNDVFLQLGMYWQLHLAYDGGDRPMDFYNRFFKAWKDGTFTRDMTGLSYDEKVALTASGTANRDLTEFFERWGMSLSEAVRAKLSAYEQKEERAVWYLSDQSRRERIGGAVPAIGTITAAARKTGDMTIEVTITPEITGTVQGYEILRNGQPIAFVPASGTGAVTYTDAMGSAGNRVYTYKAVAYGVQGNKIAEASTSGIQLTGLEGDEITFMQAGTLGVLARDYSYGPQAQDVIPQGSIVITGTYRGDVRFLTMEVKGRFTRAADAVLTDTLAEERAIDGYALFFAEETDAAAGDVQNGIFVFVPDLEREAQLQEGEASRCSGVNLLPSQIQAVLYRTEKAGDASSRRKTAETMWIYTPGGTDLPTIELEGGEK